MAVRRYRFRDFLLTPATRELRQGDELVALPASALDCLVYLVEHRDRAVGRDELIAAVWGRADVADTLLAQTVMRVRRTLGDSGSDGAIRTIARFGYHWVEDTREEIDGESSDVAASTPSTGADVAAEPTATAPPRRRIGLEWVAIAIALVALLAAGAAWWWSRDPRPTVASTDGATGSSAAMAESPVESANAASPDTAPALVLPATVPDASDWRWLRLGLMDLVGNRLREGGVPTAPAERVLAMLERMRGDAVAAPLRIAPRADVVDGRWRVSLQLLRDDGDGVTVQADDDDVLAAARAATDLLLVRLGHAPPADDTRRQSLPLQQLLQHTRAAILADQFDLARELIAQAPPALRDDPEVELRLAQIDQGEGDDAAAARRLTVALENVPADTHPVLRGRMLTTLGAGLFRRGDLGSARETYDEAIGVLEAAGEPLALGAAYAGRAAVAASEDDLDAASADLARARVEMQAAGDALAMAQMDMNLGLVEAARHRPAQALRLLEQAERRIAGIGAREELAYVRYALVGLHLRLLDPDGAEAIVRQVWPPQAHTGNLRLRHLLTLARAAVLATRGELMQARSQLQALLDDSGIDASLRRVAQARLAQVFALGGRHEEALAQADAAFGDALAREEPDLYADLGALRVRLLAELGRGDEAAQALQALSGWLGEHDDAWRRLQVDVAAAELAWARSPDEASLSRLAAAFDDAAALGVPDDLVAAAEPYVFALLQRGALDTAATVVGRVAAWAGADPRAAWMQAQLYRAQGRVEAWREGTEQALRLAGERQLPAPGID